MTRLHLSASTRAVLAGAICLAIVGGMLVGHAWPLWTGRTVVLAATVNTTQRRAPGEYVRLSTAADTLRVTAPPPNTKYEGTLVRAIDPWVTQEPGRRGDLNRRLRGKTVYVQLDPNAGGEYAPVSVSLKPVAGAVNLRGIVTWPFGPDAIHIQYGIDAFYMQEGQAELLEKALREKHKVQMEVAIAASGRARIQRLLVDGAPVR